MKLKKKKKKKKKEPLAKARGRESRSSQTLFFFFLYRDPPFPFQLVLYCFFSLYITLWCDETLSGRWIERENQEASQMAPSIQQPVESPSSCSLSRTPARRLLYQSTISFVRDSHFITLSFFFFSSP